MELEEAIKQCKKFIKVFEKDDTKSVIGFDVQAIEIVLQALEKVTEERDIYKEEHDKITKALNLKEGSLNPPAELVIESLKKELENIQKKYELAIEQNVKDYKNSIPKKKIEDKIEECIKIIQESIYKDSIYCDEIRAKIQVLQEILEE